MSLDDCKVKNYIIIIHSNNNKRDVIAQLNDIDIDLAIQPGPAELSHPMNAYLT